MVGGVVTSALLDPFFVQHPWTLALVYAVVALAAIWQEVRKS